VINLGCLLTTTATSDVDALPVIIVCATADVDSTDIIVAIMYFIKIPTQVSFEAKT
jgi:hypothetical protein